VTDTTQLRHVAFDLLQRMERFGDWSVRVWRYEHPTQGLIEPPLFWYEVTDRHVAVRTSAPAFTAADAAFSAGCSAIVDVQAAREPDHRHALEVVADMIRGGDIDAALAHAEEVLRG
jgi:hypothetical protein